MLHMTITWCRQFTGKFLMLVQYIELYVMCCSSRGPSWYILLDPGRHMFKLEVYLVERRPSESARPQKFNRNQGHHNRAVPGPTRVASVLSQRPSRPVLFPLPYGLFFDLFYPDKRAHRRKTAHSSPVASVSLPIVDTMPCSSCNPLEEI